VIDQSLKLEGWRRLANDQSLADLSIPPKNGRLDLTGLVLPEPRIVQRWQTALANVAQVELNGVFRKARLRNLDFSGSKLPSLHFTECEISNCIFDRCDLRDLRLCDTTFRDCTFHKANLRDGALGAATVSGPFAGKRNSFIGVDFSKADLRKTVYVAADFERCLFRNTILDKVGFGTSTFVDCQFEGELREVLFWRSDLFARGLAENAFPPNEMKNVDFSHARLLDVEFRGLTLDQVKLPLDDEHIVINDLPMVLDKIISALHGQADETARVLTAYLGIVRKWAVPGARGVLNKRSIAEAVNGEAVERLVTLIEKYGSGEKPERHGTIH
jgi:uncharacterized protein YjbI with pentapeptide repeats